MELIRTIEARSARVGVVGMGYVRIDGRALQSHPLDPAALSAYDCAVIVTDHSGIDYRMIIERVPAVVDARNATRGVDPGGCLLRRL